MESKRVSFVAQGGIVAEGAVFSPRFTEVSQAITNSFTRRWFQVFF